MSTLPDGAQSVHGEMLDLSETGAGVLLCRAVEPMSVLSWRVHLRETPVAAPILAQVRWVATAAEGGFRAGLVFLA